MTILPSGWTASAKTLLSVVALKVASSVPSGFVTGEVGQRAPAGRGRAAARDDLAVRLHRQREDPEDRVRLERGVQTAVRVEPQEMPARGIVGAGELAARENLAVRLDGEHGHNVVDAGEEREVQRAIGVEAREPVAVDAIDSHERPAEDDFAVRLHRQTVNSGGTAGVHGGIEGAVQTVVILCPDNTGRAQKKQGHCREQNPSASASGTFRKETGRFTISSGSGGGFKKRFRSGVHNDSTMVRATAPGVKRLRSLDEILSWKPVPSKPLQHTTDKRGIRARKDPVDGRPIRCTPRIDAGKGCAHDT